MFVVFENFDFLKMKVLENLLFDYLLVIIFETFSDKTSKIVVSLIFYRSFKNSSQITFPNFLN